MSEAVLRRESIEGTKLKVLNTTMKPSLLYACESGSLAKQQKSKSAGNINKCFTKNTRSK